MDKAAAVSPARSRRKAPPAMTVSQVARQIKDVINAGIPGRIRVVGEISNFSNRTHWFFSLKDEQTAIRAVCFASSARKVSFDVRDGLQVIATGRVDYFEGQGSVQLYVDKLEPAGEGSLEQQLRALIESLRQAGYFDPAHKKPLPLVPRRVAVVTSRSGAALQDVIKTAHHRWPGCQLLLMDVRVQGEAAAPEIARALDLLSQHGQALDIGAIILTRGGGSIEDLWAFNEKSVADAVYRCNLPIVAAIGHETDTTIAELVADHRCSTPTQAAMLVVPDRAALAQQLDQVQSRLTTTLRRGLTAARTQLEALSRHPILRRPSHMLAPAREKLDRMQADLVTPLQQRLRTANQQLHNIHRDLVNVLQQRCRTADQQLTAHEKHLQAIGPQSVLERGFSYTLTPDGSLLSRIAQANPGQRITTVLADGRFHSTIDRPDSPATLDPTAPAASTAPVPRTAPPSPSDTPAAPTPTPPRPRRRTTRKPPPDAPTLF